MVLRQSVEGMKVMWDCMVQEKAVRGGWVEISLLISGQERYLSAAVMLCLHIPMPDWQ